MKKNLKIKVQLIACVLACILSLSACQGAPVQDTTPPKNPDTIEQEGSSETESAPLSSTQYLETVSSGVVSLSTEVSSFLKLITTKESAEAENWQEDLSLASASILAAAESIQNITPPQSLLYIHEPLCQATALYAEGVNSLLNAFLNENNAEISAALEKFTTASQTLGSVAKDIAKELTTPSED